RARAPRRTSFFCVHRSALWAPPPPGRGELFGFKFSSRPHPWKFGVKRFLVLREIAGAEVGWPVLGYLLEKNFRRRDRDQFRPGGWMHQSAVPRCAILSVGSTGGIG